MVYTYSVDTCSPATIYIIIAIIVAIIAISVTLFNSANYNFATIICYICSQLLSILICYAIIVGVCSINLTLAWVSVILIAICAFSGIISMFVNPNYYGYN